MLVNALDKAFQRFQFQYGSIKREAKVIEGSAVPLFQFQYGSIKSIASFLTIT